MCCFRLNPFICAALALVATTCLRADNTLTDRIEAVIKSPEYKQAHWGILVVDAATGKTVYEHNPDSLCVPASTTKLYSCAAALIALGPDYKFETPVYRRGNVTNGKLDGDLILVAQGDLTMGGRTDASGRMAFKNTDHIYAGNGSSAEMTDTDPLAGLKTLAKQIAGSGIREVTGDVLVDDRYFAKARGSGSGPDVLTPIIINDNVVDVITTPADKVGGPATVRIRPETGLLQIDAQVVTVENGRSTRIGVFSVGRQRCVVRGQIALKSRPVVRIYPMDDPTAWARALFIDVLGREGVKVSASPLQTPQAELPEKDNYAKLTRVASFTSPPFSEAIRVTLKVSHNLYASTLPLLIAARNGKRTLADGLRIQKQILADLGVDVSTISFGGGAGGERADCITPRATVQLLQALAKRPDYPAFRAGLPILAVDGTLAEAAASDSPAKGKVHAKTGTLLWADLMNGRSLLQSKALAGTMTTATGHELFVALFVNNVPLPPGVTATREGKTLGRLCEILYENVP